MRPLDFNLRAPSGVYRSRFILAMALTGPTVAIIRFGEVIARKSLDAGPAMITLLTMVATVSNFFALWAGQVLKGRDQRPYILIAGIVTSLALFSGMFLNNVGHLLALYLFFYIPYTMLLTGQNRVLQQHVDKNAHGGLFGTSYGLREAFAAVVSFAAGIYMDRIADGYRQVFLFASVFNLAATFVFASIATRADRSARISHIRWRHLCRPLVDVVTLLKRRPEFFRFEIGFMIYGIAFMTTLPVVPLFLVDELQLGYTTIGLARGTVFQLLIIPSIALFGRWFDRVPVHTLAARVFAMLALFPICLILAKEIPTLMLPLTYAAFALFGFAMGGVQVLWSISSVRFAGDEDAGLYQSVHIALTAVRGLLAPPIALLIMTTVNTVAALGFAMLLWLAAGGIMAHLQRRDGALLQTG